MGFLTLRRFAPACGCPSVSRPSIARAHDPFESRWRRCGDVGFRPSGPTVVGRSSTPDGIGRGIDRPDREFVARGDRSRICDSASGLRSRLRSVPATVRLLRRADPALGFRRGPSQGVARRCAPRARPAWSSALATRTLSQSVAFRAASPCRARTVVPRPGRVRCSSDGLDIRPARPPLKPLRAAHRLCVKECQDQRQAIPMTCFLSPTARGTF